MRVFLAVELEASVRESLHRLTTEIELPGARFVPPENLHLTLRFLGETSAEVTSRICESLRGPLAAVEPFSLTLAGLGVFPSPRRPRVLWVAVSSPPAALFQAQSAVEEAVRNAGLPPEPRPFEPHLTLARFGKREPGLGALLDSEIFRREHGTVSVSEVTCLESRLGPRKASYRAFARMPLGSGQGSERLV